MLAMNSISCSHLNFFLFDSFKQGDSHYASSSYAVGAAGELPGWNGIPTGGGPFQLGAVGVSVIGLFVS